VGIEKHRSNRASPGAGFRLGRFNGVAQVKNANLILMLFWLGACYGCSIHRVTIRTGVSGRIIDAETKAPVQGAGVALSDYTSNTLASVNSTPDGKFTIPPKRETHFHCIGKPIEDYFPIEYTLRVNHPGYRAFLGHFLGNNGFLNPTVRLMEIELQPLTR
jgi:hypothetical protein